MLYDEDEAAKIQKVVLGTGPRDVRLTGNKLCCFYLGKVVRPWRKMRWLAGSWEWSRVQPTPVSIRSHLSCLTHPLKSSLCLASAEWASVLSSRHSLTRRKRRWTTWKSL